jgi:hypothetical protein
MDDRVEKWNRVLEALIAGDLLTSAIAVFLITVAPEKALLNVFMVGILLLAMLLFVASLVVWLLAPLPTKLHPWVLICVWFWWIGRSGHHLRRSDIGYQMLVLAGVTVSLVVVRMLVLRCWATPAGSPDAEGGVGGADDTSNNEEAEK